MARQHRRLRRAVHAMKRRVARRQRPLRLAAHRLVRLDAVDDAAHLQQRLAENPGPGADVGNDGSAPYPQSLPEAIVKNVRVPRPVRRIVGDTVRKTLRRINSLPLVHGAGDYARPSPPQALDRTDSRVISYRYHTTEARYDPRA